MSQIISDKQKDLKRLVVGNARIDTNYYIENALEGLLKQAIEQNADNSEWQNKTKNKARTQLLTGARIRSVLWFLWRFQTFGIDKQKLKALADAYEFPYLTAQAAYPWFVQSHLQALISLKHDTRADSSLEQERRILSLLADIGLLDRRNEKNGRVNTVLLRPNVTLKALVDKYLDILSMQENIFDEGEAA